MFNPRYFYLKLKRKLLYHTPPSSMESKKIRLNLKQVYLSKMGDQNKDKVFYIIQRHNGEGGLFSDLVFVVNHLRIANQYGFIPVVDMENFPRWYNENRKIKKTNNAWNYYFKSVSNYSLEEVYKSRNLLITNRNFYSNIDFIYTMDESKELTEIFKKFIIIDEKITKIINKFSNENFKGKKILGVHFRGTSYKYGRNPYPATVLQMKKEIKKIMKENKYEKFFLVTEDIDHLNPLIKEFGDKLIYLKNTFRSRKKVAFQTYPRLNHRYKLGRDLLIETCLLSKCDGFLDTKGNIRSAVITMNLNINQKRYLIDNGFNLGLPILGNYMWYIKCFLPEFLGGFKK